MPSIGSRITRLLVKYYLAPKFAPDRSIEEQRRALCSVSKLARLPRGTSVERVSLGTIPAEWVRAPSVPEGEGAVILYFHGGGFFIGSCETHRELVTRISKASNVRILQIEYRLAPEHKFPAANEDCLTAYRYLIDQGISPKSIVLGGDSAGGCLTIMTLLSLRDAGDPLPAAAFMLSPVGDCVHYDGESYQSRAELDPWLNQEGLELTMGYYHDDVEEKPPILSPIRQDLGGLPPLLIQVGDDEILLSDSIRMAERAKEAGVDVILEKWDYMWHVFQSFAVTVPEGRRAIKNIGAFVHEHIGRIV